MKSKKSEQWLSFSIPSNHEIEDTLSAFLFELGCVGTQQLESAILAYFQGDICAEEIRKEISMFLEQLQAQDPSIPIKPIEINEIKNRDWNEDWKKHFIPIRISRQFIIKPTWVELKENEGAIVIEMDPKQAFGTGHHATTQIMLQLLEEYPLTQKRILDVGTGTAILAIAAIKLGARQVVAIDIDPVAAVTAFGNCQLNSTLSHTLVIAGTVDAIKSGNLPFDMILANINKSVILNSIDQIQSLLAAGGQILLSGLLLEDIDIIKRKFKERRNMILSKELHREEWVGLVFSKLG